MVKLHKGCLKMEFYGIQKLSVVDYDGKLACTLFTGGCNMVCGFCHNSDLVFLERKNIETISEEYVLNFLEKRKNVLNAVCITGGEPSLHKDLLNFLIKVKKMGYLIKIDTNGTKPHVIEELIKSKLCDYVALDVKNDIKNYPRTIGLKKFDYTLIEQTIQILKKYNAKYELRTTLVKEFHDIESITNLSYWLKGEERLYLQKFIDSGKCIESNLHEVDYNTCLIFKEILEKNIKNVYLRGY